MGSGNLRGFLSKPDAHVLAVCDVDARHRSRAVARVNEKYETAGCAEYNDFRELLARSDIDAVCLSLPDQWHAIAGVAAARARKDVYAEKPLAYTIPEGRAICEAVKKYAIVWQTGSQQRSDRNFRFACELVRNGRIGEVKLVEVGLPNKNSIHETATSPQPVPEGFDYDMWLGPAPWKPYTAGRCHWNFRWISDYSGGQITDWAGHHCDIAQWGMGTERTGPSTILGGGGVFPPDGLYDTVENWRFECRYAEGFRMKVAGRNRMGVTFYGSEGRVYVTRGSIETEPKSLLNSVIGPNEIHLYESGDHRRNFLDCVRGRREPIAPAEIAQRSISVGHLGIIAIKLGRKLVWDAAAERFVNDTEADRLLSRPMRSPWHL
jgi:predicted dehydrogenase